MQDKDFDRFIQQAFDNQPEPEYNPADWDKLEDRLHNLNAAQPNAAAATSASAGLAKLGVVASAILVTALNVALLVKPEVMKDAIGLEEKAVAAAQMPQTEAEIAPDNTRTEVSGVNAAENKAAEIDQNQTTPVLNTLPAVTAEYGTDKVAVVKPAAVTTNKKTAVRNAAQANRTATTNWAWPAVAANRPGSNMGNQGMSAGQPVALGLPCNQTFKPEIATVLIGKDTLQGSRIALSSCQMLQARIFIKTNEAEKVNLTSNVAQVLPGAQLVTNAETNTTELQWQPAPDMARQQPYNFTVWVADAGCANATPRAYQFAVQVSPAFTASFNGLTRISKGQESTLEVKGAPRGSTYQWVTGNKLVAENETGRLVTAPVQTTTYRVLVTAPTGCVFTDSLKVEVAPGDMLATAKAIPNIFTPNNDGLNDYFEVQLPEEGPYNLEVFDRDGKMVYAQKKYDNRWNAPKLASGTYFYIITTPRENKTYKGWVEILR
ncbi:gliding motility-associated C-terminal domain-containing protein [Adhaeribacter sp. BT258]|uniref:Gliding motility-associated C-terminal domain-containing protein n=1 Tax=Adhaeribacter terrigena TaxID=2793070 RepID=A0ABS1C3K9_9BACT|nr:gliding motility-associated C-terminal domain-containing protein [Adhaeribacter terrigena]MBK0403981.1 gliding motility-associated C-terminal domain-containing protein [Adhaeribacter terrigena]